jgi:hypothetical protein
MEEERSKLGKSSWIMLGISVLALGIFFAVFMKLQEGHGDDVARCVEKCKTMPECRYVTGEGGNPCEELCGIAPAKATICMDTKDVTCEAFSACVVENP